MTKGGCLEVMKDIPSGSVDLILCDPPYGTTNCEWDKRIDFEPMWQECLRVAKHNAAMLFFSQLPFGSDLIQSQRKLFRYEWIWHKNLACGFLNAKKMPLRAHENILVFYRALPTYNPQFTPGKPYKTNSSRSRVYGKKFSHYTENDGTKYHPKDLLQIKFSNHNPHATQKPVELLRYLVRTYSNEGEVVLDFCCGSGSTCVAAVEENRQFIGIELDEKYFDVACDRVVAAQDKIYERS